MQFFSVTSLRRFITAGLFIAGMTSLTAQTTYRFKLDALQTAPATASRAQGWGIAVLNAAQTTLTLDLTHNISGATAGHIHQAAAGARGPEVFTLASVASPVSQSFTMTPALVTALNSDQLYIDLHSGSYPAGEIRAQIVSVTTRFPLEGLQEVPPTGSTASGICDGILNAAQTSFTLNCTHNVVSGTAAHIHPGAVGGAGAPVQTLTLTATTASTVWALSAADVTNLLAGNLYVNIHNAVNGGGDIRGQIMAKWIRFPLSGAQEVPGNASTATGTGLAYVTPDEAAITAGPVTHTVVSPSAAHIHEAPYGVAGPVIFTFPSPVSPFSSSGPLSAASAVKFLAGLHYVNIHSGAFPGGEIRGQMADRDDDGIMDNADKCPSTYDPAQADSDFDGTGDACDCAQYDNTQQSFPTAALSLTAAKNVNNVNLAWAAPAIPGGSPLRFDAIRSAVAGDFSAAVCVAANLSGTLTTDTAPPGSVYYLIRSKTDCGKNLGFDSSGIARSSPACGNCPAITVNPSTLSAGTVNVLYTTVNFTQVGGTTPITWSLVSGALPLGMSFSAAGALSGTPTRPGSYPLVFKVTDVNGCSGTRSITLVINCPVLTMTPAGPALTDAFYNASYNNTLTASGGQAPYAYAVTSGALPTNLSLAGATGALSGIPNVTGAFSFTVTATDATTCTVAKAYTLASRPDAILETYPQTVIGNVSINSALIPYSVTANDQFPAGATISAFDASSIQGGTVVMTTSGAGMGQFTYNPPAGYEGTDTFTYTLSSNGQTDTATVSVPVAGMVWFINTSAASCVVAGCGRLSNPFSTLAAFQTLNNGTGNNPAANDNIFLYESATDYVGPVTLLSGQKLIGQDATSTLVSITGLTPGSGSAAFPAMNTGGAITNLSSATDAVRITTGSSNTIRGLTLGNVTASGTAINMAPAAVSFGTLSISVAGSPDVVINSNGRALNLQGGTLNAFFVSVTTTGGTNGISLTGIAGTTNLGTGSLSGATGATVLVSGGTGTVIDAGTITQTSAARVVDIQSKTGGTITLNGAVTSNTGTGTGVLLNNNTGATVNFAGGIILSTGANAAFTATGGGTVNVCDENPCNPAATGALVNTLTTTSGTALNVVSTVIGANKLEFRSISSNGAVSGIILNTTGNGGGLKISGTGGAGTGGTILNSTTDGVVLTATDSPTLNSFNITDSAGAATDDGLVMTNITGTVTIAGCAITNSPHNGVTIDNFNTNMAGFSMTGSSITCASGQPCQPSGTLGNDGLLLQMRGTSVLPSGLITGSTFSGLRAVGVQIQTNDSGRIGANAGGTILTSFTVQSNTFTGNGQGIDIDESQVSNMTFQVLSNTIVAKLTAPGAIPNQASSNAINAFTAAGADTGPASHSFVGKIDGNIIGTQGVKDSGSGFGSGIRVVVQGQNTQGVVTVSNNTIREVSNATILNFYGQNGNASSGTNTARFRIINNTMPAISGSNLSLCGPVNIPCADTGIFVLADEGTPVCNIITGNNIYDVSTANGSFDIYLAERAGPPTGAQLTVEGTGGSNSAYIQANNTLAGASKFIDEGANTSQVGGGVCGAFPTIAQPGDEAAIPATEEGR